MNWKGLMRCWLPCSEVESLMFASANDLAQKFVSFFRYFLADIISNNSYTPFWLYNLNIIFRRCHDVVASRLSHEYCPLRHFCICHLKHILYQIHILLGQQIPKCLRIICIVRAELNKNRTNDIKVKLHLSQTWILIISSGIYTCDYITSWSASVLYKIYYKFCEEFSFSWIILGKDISAFNNTLSE